jgi:PAS domain S-box-containing protein
MGVNLQAKLRLKPFFFAPSRSFSATLAFFSISFPLLSALGWALGIPLLAQFYPTLPAMQPNTIVGLLVMSATLIIFRGKSSTTLQTIVSFFLSSSVILVGLLSFCENIFGWDLGIDKLFTGYIPLLNQTSLVHMALQTSLNFVFLGLGLIFLNIRSFPIYIAQTCAIFVGANALVAATGYIFNLSNLYIYPIVGMAIPTSIAFILLSGSFLCSRPREGLMSLLGGATRSSHMARRILFTCIIVPPLAGLITKVGVLAGWYSSNVQISLSTVFIIGIILRATWVAARQSEKEELRADEAYEKTQKINELLMQAIDERKIFTELIENSSDLIGIFYPNGEPRYLNPAGRKMLGLTPSFPIENATTSEFYTPDQRALAVDTIVKATKENGFWRGETTFRNWTTEEVIPVSQEQFLIRDPESGKDLGMGTITRNMTERKRIEAATLASEQQYKTLVESAYDSILVADANVQIILVNDQLLRKFGYSSEELIGQPLEILVPDRHKKTYSAARHSYAKDLHLHPMGTRFEFYGRRKDGKEFPVEISLSPRALSEGSGITAIIRDNT